MGQGCALVLGRVAGRGGRAARGRCGARGSAGTGAAARAAGAAGAAGGAWAARAGGAGPSSDVDVNVVVGGGLTSEGGLPLWVQRRYAAAARLHAAGGAPVLCSGGGTPHRRPPLDEHGFVVHEAAAGARYLRDHLGVRAEHIFKETASYDTIGNAYFSLACHCIPRRWTRLRVVTSEFHLDRTRLAFEWLSGLAGADLQRDFDLEFCEVPDDGAMPGEVLAARRAREAQSVRNLEEEMRRIQTFAAASKWLHSEHRCYSVRRQDEVGEGIGVDPDTMKSY